MLPPSSDFKVPVCKMFKEACLSTRLVLQSSFDEGGQQYGS